jgi:hypothetical protein
MKMKKITVGIALLALVLIVGCGQQLLAAPEQQ